MEASGSRPVPCYNPLPIRRGAIQPSGKCSIIFSRRPYGVETETAVPCGKCLGCLLKRARDWAVRIHCENQEHKASSFLTLTYSPKNLPPKGSLVKRHHQLFLKRLRKALDHPIRYFLAGEYGERFQRPHYHAILFGEDFRSDRVLHSKPSKHPLYSSKLLDEAWGLGKCLIGDVTMASAAYVARYAMKKVYGEKAFAHYKGRQPEYIAMSRGGAVKGSHGLGAAWFQKYHRDVFPSDEVIVNGVRQTPPPYFLEQLEKRFPGSAEQIKAKRRLFAKTDHPEDKTPRRLWERERVKQIQTKVLYRPYEAGQNENKENET